MKLVPSDRKDGNHYHDEETGRSVFEYTEGEKPRFCAWEGITADYVKAARTPWAESMEKAIGFLEYKNFTCEKCDKTRSRHQGKKWSDNCKDGGTHDWAAALPKKKNASGRKINIWFADSQIEEVEKVAEETGNDRASTIRELVNTGLKFRRQLDKFAGMADKPVSEQPIQ
jgi:hypothetical protein